MKKQLLALTLIGVLPAVSAAQATLAAHYELDETTGTSIVDSSGNGLGGVFQNNPALAQPGAAPGTGTAVGFDELLLQYGSVPDGAPLTTMTQDLSLAAWVWPATEGADNGVMRIFGNNESGWSCARGNGGLTFTTRFIQDYIQPASVPLQQWTHVAFVFDASFDVTFYVDGVKLGTVPGAAPALPPNAEWLIGGFNTLVEYWDGLLDDIQVYQGALTDADVTFLFTHPGATIGGAVGQAFCFGDGTGSVCPCGNTGAVGQGCANGSGQGAVLLGTGSASVAADDLGFAASNLLAFQPALLFAGDNAINGGDGIPFGDGLRCAGGNVLRLGAIAPSAAGTGSWGPGLVALGGWSAGDLKRFQVWYRDPGGSPCGSLFNLSHGVEVLFGG